MNGLPIDRAHDVTDSDWKPFPGGELEGKPPRALCADCRARLHAAARSAASPGRSALCFQCYRVELERNRWFQAAAELQTASEARFQTSLPFEPVNIPRLARLRAERQASRTAAREGAGLYVERRRRAQIEARHTLARIIQGLRERQLVDLRATRTDASAEMSGRTVTDLQLPEAWLPFVAAR
jgi:hypothetical protein